ncbi:hypothetical protein B0O99DRAFT_748729 [Bisporella sp. PMI_857]|nr:hypothetical protein B0O99DRAFT_748729 [Bisporella sp. PMI_857]
MASSTPFSYEAYLNSRKQEIHYRLYNLRNNVSQIHQWLCQYQEPWITDGQLRYAIKKWQRQEPNHWNSLSNLTGSPTESSRGRNGQTQCLPAIQVQSPAITRPVTNEWTGNQTVGNAHAFDGDNMARDQGWDHSLYLYANSVLDSSLMASNPNLTPDVAQYQNYVSPSVNPNFCSGNNTNYNLNLNAALGISHVTDCDEDDSRENSGGVTPRTSTLPEGQLGSRDSR